MPKRRAERSLTLSEAAVASGASRVTLRRRLDAGEFPHAFRSDAKGKGRKDTWRIPVSDLLSAGFVLPGDERPAAATPSRRIAELEATVAELERELAVWRARAQEREHHLDDLRAALRILGPVSSDR